LKELVCKNVDLIEGQLEALEKINPSCKIVKSKLPAQSPSVSFVMGSRSFIIFSFLAVSILIIMGIYLIINRDLYMMEEAIEIISWTIFLLIIMLLCVFLFQWFKLTGSNTQRSRIWVTPKNDKTSGSMLRNFKIFWIHKEYVLKKEKKVIYSAFVLFVGFITTLSVCDQIVDGRYNYFSDTWSYWLIFSLVELYVQSKLWSEVFRFKYPIIRKKAILERAELSDFD
jgi:uridine kinase